MPIYAYRCSACGHAQDHLQKMSDDPLHACPACGAHSYVKQVTAAGFQLKGSGWYVTDFREGNKGAAAPKEAEGGGDKSSEKTSEQASEKGSEKSADKAAAPASGKAADAPAAAPAPAPAASKPAPPPSSST
jgi:putative FmdB family regulatory protein